MVRILTVTHFFESHGGGIERVAGHLCRQFAAMGHETAWAASNGDAPPDTGQVEAIGLRCFNIIERLSGLPMPIPTPAALRALVGAVRQSDAVIIHDALYLTSIAAMIAARTAGRPVILVQHIAAIPFASKLLRWTMKAANQLVTRPMLRSADRVIYISATTRAAFGDTATKAAALTIFNGVDGMIFRPSPLSRNPVRTELAIPLDRPLMLFVGRFVEKKGLKVLAALARARPDLHFALAGQGPVQPKGWNLPNVTVVSGRSGQSLAELYAAADLLILPSVGEGYPLVMQEAMACGLPIVCGSESALADPGAAAWLKGVPVILSEPDDTATRFSAAIDAPAMTAAQRQAMADYAARTYSWPGMAQQLVGALAVSGDRR
ncbi:MAG: glycosyltransferase family 4 protein [Acetobacteraceae bacterium]|nr:glycosyltransferase family 4 protein [Acetobacteraceae bacterium]